MDGPQLTISPTSRHINRLRTLQSSIQDRLFTYEPIQTRPSLTAQATPSNPSSVASKTSLIRTPHTHQTPTIISTSLVTETASMANHTTTTMRPSVLPQPLLLLPSRCRHQAVPPHRRVHHRPLEGTRLPEKVQRPKLLKPLSDGRHRMERRILRSGLDEDVDHCCQNRESKPVKSESSEPAYVANSSRRLVTRESHVLVASLLMPDSGKCLVLALTLRTSAIS